MVDEARGSEKKAKKSTTNSATPAKTINKEMSPSSSAIDEKSISSAMRSRVEYFKEQADSLTLEGVRRVLEKDLGLDKYALDAHKRFIKECLQECFDAGSNENVSKSSGETGEEVINSMKEETLDLSGNHPPDQTPKGLEDKENVLEYPVPVPSAGVDTAPDGTKKTEGLPRAKAISEETVKNIIRKRASYFRNHSETLTLVGVRRLLEQDLKLEKHALDAYRELIKEQLDKVLQSSGVTEPANGVKNKKRRKATSGGDSDSSDSVEEMEDEEVKPKKRSAPKQKMNVSGGLKNREGPSKETAKVSNSNKRKKPAESISEETGDAKDGGDLSDDGQSQSSGDKSVKMSASGSSGGRGAHLLLPPSNPDDRIWLTPPPPPQDTDFADHKVVKTLAQLCLKNWPTDAITWAETPDIHKELVWQEFQKYYQWDPAVNATIYRMFCQKAKLRTKDNIKNAREKAEKAANKDNTDISAYNPPWCDQQIWAGMCLKWQREAWVKRRSVASKNRSSGASSGSTHAPPTWKGGSISQAQHYMTQESERPGEDVSWLGLYVDKRRNIPVAHQNAEIYKALMDAKYPEGTERPATVDVELWEQAAGVKKNYVKGLGTKKRYSSAETCSSSSFSSQYSQTSRQMPHSPADCLRVVSQDVGLLAEFDYMLSQLTPEQKMAAAAKMTAAAAAAPQAASQPPDDSEELDLTGNLLVEWIVSRHIYENKLDAEHMLPEVEKKHFRKGAQLQLQRNEVIALVNLLNRLSECIKFVHEVGPAIEKTKHASPWKYILNIITRPR